MRPPWAVTSRLGSFLTQQGGLGDPTWADFGAQRGAKMRPNFDPRQIKIDVENEVKKRRLLKIVLEPSWVDLGSSWVPSWGQNRALALGGARFFENRLFGENEGSRGDLGRSWVDLGRPRGVKMRAAEGQKRSYVEMILSSEVEVKLR